LPFLDLILMPTASQVLGTFAAGLRFENIPPAVVERAKDCIIDTVAAAAFGAINLRPTAVALGRVVQGRGFSAPAIQRQPIGAINLRPTAVMLGPAVSGFML